MAHSEQAAGYEHEDDRGFVVGLENRDQRRSKNEYLELKEYSSSSPIRGSAVDRGYGERDDESGDSGPTLGPTLVAGGGWAPDAGEIGGFNGRVGHELSCVGCSERRRERVVD